MAKQVVEQTQLTAQEVNAILLVSQRAGVTKLTFRGLSVEFEAGQPRSKQTPAQQPLQPGQASPETLAEIARKESEAKAIKQETEELLLTNPELYEEMIGNGELEPDGHITTSESDE